MDIIKDILGSIFNFLFWLVLISFTTGYTLGNYYAVKSTLDDPLEFNYEITPAYIVMLFKDDPHALKYKTDK